MTAQVVTLTESSSESSPLQKIKWVWTSTDAGAVSSATTNKYTGEIVRLVTIPSDGPTDNYDVTVLDSDSADVLMGAGANRDTTNTEQVLASSLGVVYDSALTLTIANAGDAKSGTTIVYIK